MHSGEYLTISISDPVKLTDKFGAYICYKVTTATNKQGFAAANATVVRRFSDFVWLARELSRLNPGVIIPSLPEKQTVGRFSSDFVEYRLRALEKFLDRCAKHRELSRCPLFVAFLEMDEAALAKKMDESKASKPKLSSSAMNWFESTVHSIQNNGKASIEKSAADLKVEDLSAYINALEKQMKSVAGHSEAWIKKSREACSSLTELGAAFKILGESESDSEVSELLKEVGAQTESVAANESELSSFQEIRTEEPLHEYYRVIQSVRAAIQQRQERKQAYVDALTEVEVRQTAHNKLVGQPGKEALAAQKQELVLKAQAAADAAKTEFERVSDKLLCEFEDFKHQRAQDMKAILQQFVELQIEYQRKSLDAWVNLSHTLDGVHDFSGGYPAPRPPSSAPGSMYESFPHDHDDHMTDV